MAATRAGGRLHTAWRALPGDALGLLAVALSGARTVRRVLVDPPGDGGPGGSEEAFVHEDPRLASFLDAVPLRPTAMTFGRHILARGRLPEETVRHELEHVRQWARLGPLFLPLYVAESVYERLAGRDRYRDNRFEAAARRRELEPSTASSSAPSARTAAAPGSRRG